MTLPRKIILTLITISGCLLLHGQGEAGKRTYQPVDFTLQIKNMHLWRGMEVSDGMTFATDIRLKDKKDMFNFGLWGGISANGSFKEFDYYASFSKAGFILAVWDIYNFSPGASYNNRQMFNYKAKETGHFVDVSASYQFQKNFPLKISWSTIVFGRDRDGLNSKNRYSSYVFAGYPILRHRAVNLDFGIAGAFALDKGKDKDGNLTKANFYGDTAGIVDVNLTASKTLDLWGYKLPVSLMVMWNPQNNYANIQIALNLF